MQDSLDSFEKGMGIVLRNAWSHIEALQTTDVPLLVEYITGVRETDKMVLGVGLFELHVRSVTDAQR